MILAEDDAQAILLIRAIEETDRKGVVLPLEVRRAATEAARKAHPDGDAWLTHRARALVTGLKPAMPFLQRFMRYTSPVRGLLLPALAVAFLLGLLTNALGPEKRINVLALPLVGLIAWNLTVLAVSTVRSFLPLDLSGVPRFVGWLETMARRLISRVPRKAPEGEKDPLKEALERYLAEWLPKVTPLAAARGKRLLHASSLVLILGVVVGMYLRGVAFQYDATWGSTFISGRVADGLLNTVLAPASALLGIDVPPASAIVSPSSGDAAPWIHLWACTAALFVGVPRLLLAGYFHLRAAHRRRRFEIDLPDAYRRRLLASVDTSERWLDVLPFSYRPSAKATEALQRILYDFLGHRSEVRIRPTLDYGAEPAALEPGRGRLRMVLFGLAQTPEDEVHGELLRHLCEELPDGQALLVAVDGSTYRERLAGSSGGDERLAQRRRAWDRVVGAAVDPQGHRKDPLTAVHLDLLEEPEDEILTDMLTAAWPKGVLEVET